GLMAMSKSLPFGEKALAVGLVLWALLNIGGVFDHRRWALCSELVRLPVTAAVLAARLPEALWTGPVRAGLGAAVVTLCGFLLSYRSHFLADDGLERNVS